MNIVETAAGRPSFSKLASAIKSAGLADALSGKGPFTVFAPSDDAFAKLPKGALDDLVKPENKAKLVALLKGHVIDGKHMAAEFADNETSYATLAGPKIAVNGAGGKVKVGAAQVATADIVASNGVIHSIDTVISAAS